MYKTVKDLIIFCLPIVVGNLSHMLIGAGDVFVASHYNTYTLAAIGIANGITSTIFNISYGLLMGIAPILSIKKGRGENIEHDLLGTITYSIIITFIFCLLSLSTIWVVPYMGFDENLNPLIIDYIKIFSWSFFGANIFVAIREYLQANHVTFLPNALLGGSVFVNIALNFLLVFGFSIIPSLGIKGIAYASVITRSLMAIVLLYICKDKLTGSLFNYDLIKKALSFSVPIALAVFLEVSAFSGTSILAGRLGVLQVAAHNIVMTVAAISFMVPLAIASGIAVKIGDKFGAKDYVQVKEYIKGATIIVLGFMTFTSLLYYFAPGQIASFFDPTDEVMAITKKIFLVAGLFQIFDGLQVTYSGILRGLGESKPTMFTALIAYWILGIPIGNFLTKYFNPNVVGLWVGLWIGLATVAIILMLYTFRKINKM